MRGNTEMRSVNRGFTLIEMMIVIVIISILSSVAAVSYRSYVVHARRTSAQETMMELQQKVEESYALNHNYNEASSLFTSQVIDQYVFSFELANSTNGLNGYQIKATAQDSQASSDKDCAVLFLNRNGSKGGGTLTGSGVQGTCW